MKSIFPKAAFAAILLSSCSMLENMDYSSMTVCFEDINLDENGYIASVPYSDPESVVTFRNSYNADYGSFEGFAFSKMNDTETPGMANQYSVFADGGNSGSTNFAVYYYNTYESALEGKKIVFGDGIKVDLESVYVNNSTYAALAVRDGSDFSRKFADGDWFLLTIEATLADGEKQSVEYYLADYRDGKTFICDQWTKVDLSSLKNVVSVDFILTSSDSGEWGMNTPAYFCMDDFTFKYKKF